MTSSADRSPARGHETGESAAFLGVGRMGTALVRAFVATGTIPRLRIVGTHHRQGRAAELQESLGVQMTTSNTQAVEQASMVFLCVRPEQVQDLVREIAGSIQKHHTVVSLAVGVPLEWLRAALPGCGNVFHVHPTSPVMDSGSGMSFLVDDGDPPTEARVTVESIFSCLGAVLLVPEDLVDRYAVLSGSAPAFFAEFYTGWKSLAEQHGVPEHHAEDIVRAIADGINQRLRGGSGALIEMQEEMATPGGITRPGLDALRRSGFRAMLDGVVETSLKRIRSIRRLLG